MNCTIKTTAFALYGVLGQMTSENGNFKCYTLEHAYSDLQFPLTYVPKVARGVYTCQRGKWTLDNGVVVETFRLMNVPPFQGAQVTDILLHVGNYNTDSKGCICLGFEMGQGCILESRLAFDAFMELQTGVNSFILTIS